MNDSLGTGSYGTVISVRHKEDNNLYAVKIICSSPNNPEKYRKRELLTSHENSPSRHENIVGYYDSWKLTVEGKQSTLCVRLELCDKNFNNAGNTSFGKHIVFYHAVMPKWPIVSFLKKLTRL